MSPKFNKVEYVLFDLDGLMVDTEVVYTEVTDDILAKHGVKQTWEIKAGLMGKPEREAAAHLLSHFPGIDLTIDDYLRQRNAAQDARWPTVPLLPGVARLVKHLHRHQIPIAIATGSHRRAFTLKISGHPDVFDLFERKMACADDGAVPPGRGKPHPDIYLFAARELLGRDVGAGDAGPGELSEAQVAERAKGLVFEDAISGMQSGRRAGMQVVWVPEEQLLAVPYDGVERVTQTLRSIEEFVPEEWGLPPYDDE